MTDKPIESFHPGIPMLNASIKVSSIKIIIDTLRDTLKDVPSENMVKIFSRDSIVKDTYILRVEIENDR